jgi:signal transduction histidine kinase
MLEALASSAAIAIENANLVASLQEANIQLRAALHAKDEMLQNVSHELRTPLAMICGFSEALDRGELGPLTEGQQRAAQIMERQGERLRLMVDRLLTLQSFEAKSLQRTRLDLGQWLPEAIHIWDVRAAQAGLTLHVQAPPTCTVMADPSFLEHVVDNLLDNAIKFTPQGGQAHVRAWAEGDEAVTAVSDSGVGIPPDKLQQVFERFYQVDSGSARRFGGMGIGLALCRAIVEAHGGRIWAESSGDGQGTTFYVALPLAKPEEGAAHATDERPGPEPA